MLELQTMLTEEKINQISSLGLAHLGDAVYELHARTWLVVHGGLTSHELHRATVRLVCAPAQAAAAQRMLPLLTEKELAVYKRARNTKVNSVPQRASLAEYHAATGVEALFGWLYLHGETERLSELFALAVMPESEGQEG